MPCYLLDNVDRQRGKGVFEGSIRGLRRLKALDWERRLSWRRNQIQSPVTSKPIITREMMTFINDDHAPAKLPSCQSRGQLRGMAVMPSRVTA
ncbi:MAG TPA: hypothetical protein VHI72_02400 [Hyphomicrobiaceae bacterium]|jgi:hypothetical protein|nr:hypothetical protein [Hyphomicrobiaceae bacterium]